MTIFHQQRNINFIKQDFSLSFAHFLIYIYLLSISRLKAREEKNRGFVSEKKLIGKSNTEVKQNLETFETVMGEMIETSRKITVAVIGSFVRKRQI